MLAHPVYVFDRCSLEMRAGVMGEKRTKNCCLYQML